MCHVVALVLGTRAAAHACLAIFMLNFSRASNFKYLTTLQNANALLGLLLKTLTSFTER
jgi:hypothetical protein